jgi:hypothetical protein
MTLMISVLLSRIDLYEGNRERLLQLLQYRNKGRMNKRKFRVHQDDASNSKTIASRALRWSRLTSDKWNITMTTYVPKQTKSLDK